MGIFYRDGLADHRVLADEFARSRVRLAELFARTAHPALGEASELIAHLCRTLAGGAGRPSLESIETLARRLADCTTEFEGADRAVVERASRLFARVLSDARALDNVEMSERSR